MDDLEKKENKEIDVMSIPSNYIEERVKETCNKLITDDQLKAEIERLLNWFLLKDGHDYITLSDNRSIKINESSSDFIDQTLNMIKCEFDPIITKEIDSLKIEDCTKLESIDNILKSLLIEDGGNIILYNLMSFISYSTYLKTIHDIRTKLLSYNIHI